MKIFDHIIGALTALIGAIVLITTGAVDLSTIADHNTITIAGAVLGVRAQRVLRLHQLPDYLGLRRSQISELVKAGLLHPFSITPNGRAKVVLEDEVAALQASAIETARAAATSKPGPLPKSLRGKTLARMQQAEIEETGAKAKSEVAAAIPADLAEGAENAIVVSPAAEPAEQPADVIEPDCDGEVVWSSGES